MPSRPFSAAWTFVSVILFLAVELVIGTWLGPLIVGAYVLCVLLMFWYFYSILAGQVIPYQDWLHHMWYRIGRGWI